MSEFSIEPSPSITTEELEQKLSEDIILLDVRTQSEYKEGHIPEATNIPLDTIEQYEGDSEKEVYVICRSGRRSNHASLILEEEGYKAINVKGGMNDWRLDVQKKND